jgi:hypothetical protein
MTINLPSSITDKLYRKCCIKYTLQWMRFKLTTLVVIGTDCTGSCKTISLNLKLKSIRIIWLTNTNISRTVVSIITHTDVRSISILTLRVVLTDSNIKTVINICIGDQIVNFYELFCSMYGRQLGTKLWRELYLYNWQYYELQQDRWNV